MKKRYLFLILLQVICSGIGYHIATTGSFFTFETGLKVISYLDQLQKILLVCSIFYLAKRPSTETLSVITVIIMYQLYLFISMIFIPIKPDYLFFTENILFLSLVYFQAGKRYKIPSDKISRTTVCLIFYRPETIRQYINSVFGLAFASVGAIINNKVYILQYGKSTVQCRKFDESHIKEHYLVIDTKVPNRKVRNIIPELLKQKARQPKTLYLRYNCLRSLKPLLNEMGRPWRYKGEVLPSIYLERIINDTRTKTR